jgi:hypothetical protein
VRAEGIGSLLAALFDLTVFTTGYAIGHSFHCNPAVTAISAAGGPLQLHK